ncbi:MAG: hypothetical protein ACLSA2_02095 [Candidatus Gastranaerophilaceae bacterium]|nr:unknown [Clostridium sp. CAG:967]
MNYLELINKCLVELNYKQVSSFSELTKNDHKKLKNILNVLNAEVCGSDRWSFLLRKQQLTIPANTGEVTNSIDGRIETVIVDGVKFDYYEDFEKFFTNAQPMHTYSLFNDKILFPVFDKEKTVEIIYYTKNHAKDEDGSEKYLMEEDTDTTLIPEPFAEPVLVYGACMRLKGNPQHVRFSYWMSMYKDALANMRSRVCASIDETPSVKMHRR